MKVAKRGPLKVAMRGPLKAARTDPSRAEKRDLSRVVMLLTVAKIWTVVMIQTAATRDPWRVVTL